MDGITTPELPQQPSTISSQVWFTGTTAEYFKIWIVNIALTIVTLGIYSAWATVRKRRYFYTNTHIEDGHFDYHANPKQILFGRVIAVVVLLLYYLVDYVQIGLGLLVLLIVLLGLPWIIVRSKAFQMRNTSFNGLRFGFNKDTKGAFKTYYLSWLIQIFSLGWALPRAMHMRTEFIADNTRYGRTPFKYFGDMNPLYSIFFKMIGLSLLLYLVLGVLFGIFGEQMFVFSELESEEPSPTPVFYAMLGVFYLGASLLYVYKNTRDKNYVWSVLRVEATKFSYALSVRKMIFIHTTNLLAIVLTLGFAVPWAQIRLAKYRTQQMTVELSSDWKEHIAAERTEEGALGDEIGEAFDLDFGAGF